MSDVTVMYNMDGYWVEVNVDCLEALIQEPTSITAMANNRVTAVS